MRTSRAGPAAGERVVSKVRDAVQPAQIRLTRMRAQSTAAFITRLTGTAVFAYVAAQALPGNPRPVLAPLTALLVVEATLLQTVRSAWRRVLSVLVGVLVAVGIAQEVGFTWWSLGAAIAASLTFGHIMRLGDHMLEVPISAMLILSLDTGTAAADRVVETVIGAASGLLAAFIASPVRLQSAEKAIEELSETMADLLDRMAAGLEEGPPRTIVIDWLERARALDREIRRVDRALLYAEDSIRLKPRAAPRLLPVIGTLRKYLETMEHIAVTIRGLTRSVADRSGDDRLMAADTRATLARTLRELNAAVRNFGHIVGADTTDGLEELGSALDEHLTAARRQRDRLAELLRSDSVQWPLHGELVVHLDRLLDELYHGHPLRRTQRARSTDSVE